MSRRFHRDPQREQFWREMVALWRQSGQSVRAFCDERGLSEPSFFAWRRTLSQRDRARVKAPPTFVPLRVVPDTVVEVALPTGLVVRVPARADVAAVAALVAALRAASC